MGRLLTAALCLVWVSTTLPGQVGAGPAEASANAAVRFEEPEVLTTDPAAARIVDLHVKARGGEEALRAMRSFVLEGRVREGLYEYSVLHYWAAPGKYRREVYREELGWRYRTLYATNGVVAWTQEVAPEIKPARTLEDNELHFVRPEMYFCSDLLDWEANGLTLLYGGEAKSAGEMAFIIRALKGKDPVYYYFDKKLFLPRSIGYVEQIAERDVEVDHFPLRWQTVDGIRMETAYEVRNDGQLLRRVEYARVEVNVPLPDELFEMPVYREVWLRQMGRGESRLEHRPDIEGELPKDTPAPPPGK